MTKEEIERLSLITNHAKA